MVNRIDPFIEVCEKDSYHICGLEHGSSFLGKCADKVQIIANALITPMNYCVQFYVRIFVLDFSPGSYYQKKTPSEEALYRGALFVSTIVLLLFSVTPFLTGTIFSYGTQLLKKDFIWEGPKQFEQEASKAVKDTVSIMTYNMTATPEFLAIRDHLRPTKDRSKEIGKAIETNFLKKEQALPDFICAQEVFDTSASKKISDDLKALGYISIVRDVGSSVLYPSSGLFLASPHRLSNVVFYPHVFKGGSESYANKGVLIATAHIGDKKIVIANTHLNGGAPGGGYLPRAIQIKAVMAHIDRYVQKMLDSGEKIEGVFLSGDTNIAPVDDTSNELVQEYEWYLHQVLYHEKTYLDTISKDQLTEKQKNALDALKQLKSAIPTTDKITDNHAWKKYLELVKIIKEGELHPKGKILEEFLRQELPKKQGGPFPSEIWCHDLDSYEKAMEGSIIADANASSKTKATQEKKRLDYNMVRSKVGLKNTDLLSQPESISSEVLYLDPTPSDHHPVYTQFKWETTLQKLFDFC